MKKLERISISDPYYREILDKETHHDHEILVDDNGVVRWKKDPDVVSNRDNISLNDLLPLLESLGHGKNSEIYRKLYRCMGYSLFGYWEVFYWDMNNPDADKYVPNGQP